MIAGSKPQLEDEQSATVEILEICG